MWVSHAEAPWSNNEWFKMKPEPINRWRVVIIFLMIRALKQRSRNVLRIQDTLKKTWTQCIFAFHKMDIRKVLYKTTQMM